MQRDKVMGREIRRCSYGGKEAETCGSCEGMLAKLLHFRHL